MFKVKIKLRRFFIRKKKRKYRKRLTPKIVSKYPERPITNLENIAEKYRILLNIPETVAIKIIWGKNAKRVLGSVRLLKDISIIRMSSYMKDYNVPEYVLEEVILHEMIHIKTGHGSTLEKSYQHAHRGGVIRKEMQKVGKEELFDITEKWIKENWYNHVRRMRIRQTLLKKKNAQLT